MLLTEPAVFSAPVRAAAALASPQRARRLLLACDGRSAQAQRIATALRAAGYSVREIAAESATLAAELVHDFHDVLLVATGAHLGTRLIEDLRGSFTRTQLPILFLATPDLRTPAAVLAAGASDVVMRCVAADELVQRIENLASVSRLQRATVASGRRFEAEATRRTAKLDMLIENGIAMSMERDHSKLLRRILSEGQRLLNCDCATMYLVEDNALRFALRTKDDALPSTRIPLYDEATGRPNEHYVSVHAAVHNRSIRIDDVYSEQRFDLAGTRRFDIASRYRTVSMLAVPMSARGGEVIGVLQFINAVDPDTGAIVPFASDEISLVEALAAQAAVALDNLRLVASQKDLIESIIRVMATAIDAKSHYTGRHCERVPELAMRLASAACDSTEGSLADFRFESEDEWQEFRIGAWLHDCGKVTTPEYVIDKATKLETIHNRIHEVRMRFEVLLRDAEIERLQAVAAGVPAPAAAAAFEQRKAALHDDFAFVAECNVGTETMDASRIERLATIARTPWLRHFDDRLGLSRAEIERRALDSRVALPAREPLLIDRPSDVVARDDEQQPDPSFGFKVDIPASLYNRGELYNLSVERGTLTREERYKINEHMIHTIMMLERIPFPKSLKRVPEYAGTHHETLDGRGYPRRLTAKELSVPSRIMAIADVFEALTASDRPYKAPKKLSETLTIMARMQQSQHIDADLFDLFLTSGVYLEYAHKHLHPALIDVRDCEPYRPRRAGSAQATA